LIDYPKHFIKTTYQTQVEELWQHETINFVLQIYLRFLKWYPTVWRKFVLSVTELEFLFSLIF